VSDGSPRGGRVGGERSGGVDESPRGGRMGGERSGKAPA